MAGPGNEESFSFLEHPLFKSPRLQLESNLPPG